MTGLEVDATVHRGTFELSVALQAAPGEVLAVLGPNGAGKTTVLRAVAGLQPLDAGVIRLHARAVDEPARGIFVPARERRVGVVFQDHRLFAHLRVIDNVAFGPRARRVGRAAARGEAGDWLDRLGLTDLAHRYPRQLSGGQAQRVALARALAARPDALLLDEPLAALDVQTRSEVQGELRAHLPSVAGPTVLVTHDPIKALLLASRIVVLEQGRVVQDGTPAEITARPLTPYVARLVGTNLWDGRADGAAVELDGGGRFAMPTTVTGAVLVAVRPSAIAIAFTRPDGLAWPATVTGLAPLGDRVRVTTAGGRAAFVDVSAEELAAAPFAPGDPVWLSVKPGALDVYPAP